MAKRISPLFDESDEEEPHINLTPLIDVVFVVLIAFMILAPLLDVDQVELAQAPDNTKKKEAPQEVSSLVIAVRRDNTIWVDKKQIALTDLDPWLLAEKKRRPEQVPKLFQDKRAEFGTYQAVKNRIEACGFEKLDVVLQP